MLNKVKQVEFFHYLFFGILRRTEKIISSYWYFNGRLIENVAEYEVTVTSAFFPGKSLQGEDDIKLIKYMLSIALVRPPIRIKMAFEMETVFSNFRFILNFIFLKF